MGNDSTLKSHLRGLAGLFPLTARGMAVLVCVALALRLFGYGAMDLMVFALGVCALVILLGCLFSVVICGLILQRRIQGAPERETDGRRAYEAGFPNETGFSLPPVGLLPLVRLQWSWQFPDRIESRVRIAPDDRLEEEITPGGRCLGNRVTRRFEVSDVLGLCRYSWRLRRERECYVLPRINTLNKLPPLHSLAAEDGMPRQSGEPVGDRMEIRPYVAGDSVRDILWKNYARTRQLNVRLRERSVAQGQRILAYLLSGPDDEAAAAVARMALESGALGEDWRFSADGTETPCGELDSALRAVARSRALGQPHSPGLERFLAQVDQRGATHCIVFASAKALSASIAPQAGGGFRGRFSLVLATDGLEESRPPPRWRRWLLRPEQRREGGGSRSELLVSCRRLRGSHASIMLVDRATGICYDDKLRRI